MKQSNYDNIISQLKKYINSECAIANRYGIILGSRIKEFAKGKVIPQKILSLISNSHDIAKELNLDIAIIDKRRDNANESEAMNVIGNEKGKQCIIVDDIVDTGGTLVTAADALLKSGAEEVQAYITHGVLSNGGMQTINESTMGGLTITDSIPQYDNKKVKLLSVGKLFSEAIRRVHHDESISVLFE